METRLFLIRHGEVAEKWRKRVYGCLDVPLSARGEAQAERAAARLDGLELAAVVSSGLARSEHGAARIVARRDALGVQRDAALREIERGDWAGVPFERLAEREPGAWEEWHRAPSTRRPPGGESLEDLGRRVLPRLDHWARVGDGGAVALVVHLWVVRVAVCTALRMPLDAAPRLSLPTGGQVVLDWPSRERVAVDGAPHASPETAPRTSMGESSAPHRGPTLVGFASDAPPSARTGWYRAPEPPR